MISLNKLATIWKINGVLSSFGGSAFTFYGNLNYLSTFRMEAEINQNHTFLEVDRREYTALHQNNLIALSQGWNNLIPHFPVDIVLGLGQLG